MRLCCMSAGNLHLEQSIPCALQIFLFPWLLSGECASKITSWKSLHLNKLVSGNSASNFIWLSTLAQSVCELGRPQENFIEDIARLQLSGCDIGDKYHNRHFVKDIEFLGARICEEYTAHELPDPQFMHLIVGRICYSLQRHCATRIEHASNTSSLDCRYVPFT